MLNDSHSFEMRDACTGVCVQSVGCDGVLDSTAQQDACGVCGGDASTCKTIKGAMSTPLTKMGQISIGFICIILM